MFGVRGFDAADPVECDLLPEGDVPELGVDSVRRSGDFFVREVVAYSFEDVRWGRGSAVAYERSLEFIDGHLAMGRHEVDARRQLLRCRGHQREYT